MNVGLQYRLRRCVLPIWLKEMRPEPAHRSSAMSPPRRPLERVRISFYPSMTMTPSTRVCVELLLEHSEDADVVYTDSAAWWAETTGVRTGSSILRTLMRRNFIPVTALIRKDLWDLLGGQRKVPMEDHDFYKRAWLHGARFKCVPEVLWSYRFHDSNQFQGVRAA
jgi:hypothetical protein